MIWRQKWLTKDNRHSALDFHKQNISDKYGPQGYHLYFWSLAVELTWNDIIFVWFSQRFFYFFAKIIYGCIWIVRLSDVWMWLYRDIKHNRTQINFIDLYHLHMNTNAFINVRFGSIWHGLLLFGGGALSPNSILAPTSVLLIICFKWSMNLQHSFFVPYANIERYLSYTGENMFQ